MSIHAFVVIFCLFLSYINVSVAVEHNSGPYVKISKPQMHNPLEKVNVQMTRIGSSNITVTVDRYEQNRSSEWFNVTWSGVEDPAYDDWIAVMVPATASMTEVAPAKWKLAAESDTHISYGNGTLRFRLISYRADVAFVFVRNGFSAPHVVASSATVRMLRPNLPLQGHLALTGKPSEMLVQWNTRDAPARPEVKWGSVPGVYDSAAVGRSFTYKRTDMCANSTASGEGWSDPGVQSVAVMTGLLPSRRYYYVFGDETYGFSNESSFLSAPPTGPDSTVRILAIADLGQGEVDGSLQGWEMAPSLTTTMLLERDFQLSLKQEARGITAGKAKEKAGGHVGSRAQSSEEKEQGGHPGASGGGDETADGIVADPGYSLLLHHGDICYARGFSSQWDNFFHQVEPLTRRMPYMVTPGNHERDWPNSGDGFPASFDSGGECGVPYEQRITMPIPGRDQQWYAFDYGPIHFLHFSTEHDFLPGSTQHAFILRDLKSVNRSVTPWLVVGAHRPFYVSSNDDGYPASDQVVSRHLLETFDDLFLKHKVDLTLTGHHHSYQRTCPLHRGVCQGFDLQDGTARAPIHLVIGNAGAGLCFNVLYPYPTWLEKLVIWWGYLRLEVSGTRLVFEAISNYDSELIDRVELVKPAGWAEKTFYPSLRNGN